MIYVRYPALQEIFDMFKVTEKYQVPKMEVTCCMGPYEDSLQPKKWKCLNLTFPSKLLFCVVLLFLQQSCSSGEFIGERAEIFSNKMYRQ